ncbi:hypothetical protein K2173_020428 [Erythroxylum novogranatense]|uniref:DNA polymerase eta n=1 Tax=Erythroxylum novogranatense TaxID=1862640 RepID=A0AAV8TGC6_9ROSI|nr:hypothetical protein K2173_020428 [Erythroxylum novogranatense]
MPVARPESNDPRIIAHVDMDCFYVQVEQRKQPELRGLPTAVVQYNEWKGGALIAVSYEARKFGVKRSMRGDEAKAVCPQINLVQVPVARGKADLNAYRNAGSEVVSILARKGRCERASIDEVYLDLTDAAATMLIETPPESLGMITQQTLESHILGLHNENENDAKQNVKEWLCRSDADHRDKLLACGAIIVAELRMQVLKETEFTCSAGIAHNKVLAKLASGMNKPAQQTVVPSSSVKGLLDSLPIKKMKQLGGKLGTSLQSDLRVNTVGDLLQFSEEKLQDLYGTNTGTWLWNIARGISGDEVQVRLLPKSHGSGKSFPGPRALKTVASVQHWLNQLCEELSERLCTDLDQNKRIAHILTLHASAHKSGDSDSFKKFPSKSCPLRYGTAKIQEDAFNLFQSALREYLVCYGVKTQVSQKNRWGITALSISASKIVDIPTGTYSITKYFNGQHPSQTSLKQNLGNFISEAAPLSPSGTESCSEVESSEVQINNDACLGEELKRTDKDQDLSCSSPKQAQDVLDPSSSLPMEISSGRKRSNRELSVYDHSFALTMPNKRGQKVNVLKKKGTIMDFFENQNSFCCLPKQGNAESDQGAGSCSVSGNCLDGRHIELEDERHLAEDRTNPESYTTDQNAQRERWSYNIDEIDPSVIDELPPEIRDEIQVWLRPHKRPDTVKRGSTIAHYFHPTKNT